MVPAEVLLNSLVGYGYDLTPVLARRLDALDGEESKKIALIDQTLQSFDRWLGKVADDQPQPSALDLAFFPRRLEIFETKERQFLYGFPPALLFLEAVFSGVAYAFKRYEEFRFSGQRDLGRASISLQACEALCHILDIIKKMGEGNLKLKFPQWEVTTDGYSVLMDSYYRPRERGRVYFTPGRNRIGISWQDWNPYGRESDINPTPILAEVRLDSGVSEDPRTQGELYVDISVVQSVVGRRNDGGYTSSISSSLTDFVFGPNRHHLFLGSGSQEECLDLIRATMKALGIAHFFRTSGDIPGELRERRSKRAA